MTAEILLLLLRAEGEEFEGFEAGEYRDGGNAVVVNVEACDIGEDVEPIES